MLDLRLPMVLKINQNLETNSKKKVLNPCFCYLFLNLSRITVFCPLPQGRHLEKKMRKQGMKQKQQQQQQQQR